MLVYSDHRAGPRRLPCLSPHRVYQLEGVKHLAVELIELTDFFLLGMVLYVVGFGMYELFIDPNVEAARGCGSPVLDELKSQIVNVIVVLLS